MCHKKEDPKIKYAVKVV
jgi:serine/threonine protein kinase